MTVFILLILLPYTNRIHFNVELALSIISRPAPFRGRNLCARLRTDMRNNPWVFFYNKVLIYTYTNKFSYCIRYIYTLYFTILKNGIVEWSVGAKHYCFIQSITVSFWTSSSHNVLLTTLFIVLQ